MKKLVYFIGFLLSIALLSNSCNIINPKEPIPTYIQLDSFIFNNPDSSFTGSSTHNIPAAWIFVNEQAIGVFDLPCTVPAIITKDSRLLIAPAVNNQGLKSYLFQYPFYTTDSTTLILNPGNIQHFQPKTQYSQDLKSAQFRLMINFEEGMLLSNSGGDTSFMLTNKPNEIISGKYSGIAYLDATHKLLDCKSNNYFGYTNNPCYLEFDYKNSVPFNIVIYAEDDKGGTKEESLAGFNPRENATKIYLELGTFIKSNPSYTKFYLKVKSNLDDFAGKYNNGYILLDNFKVIAR